MPEQVPAGSATETRSPRVIRIEPSPGAIFALLLLLAGLWVLNRMLPVMLVLVASLVIVGTISPAVAWLEGRGLRRGLAIALIFTALLGATVLLLTMTIPSLIVQARDLIEAEPVMRARLAKWLAGSKMTSPLADLLGKVKSGDLVRMAATNAIEFSARIVAMFAYVLSSVFLALYIMIDRDRLRGGLYLVVPRSHHLRLSRVMLNLETIVGAYIRGQVITSLFMAVFVFILLTACGAPNALAIAIFAGAADVLPYIGALLSVGAVAVATLSRGPAMILVVVTLMLLYEEFESRFIVPHIYGNALRLPSSVILFSLLAGTVLMGIPGALLALPVAAAGLMLVEALRVELPGQQEQPVDAVVRARDERSEAEYERRTEGLGAEEAAAVAVRIADERQAEERALPIATELLPPAPKDE